MITVLIALGGVFLLFGIIYYVSDDENRVAEGAFLGFLLGLCVTLLVAAVSHEVKTKSVYRKPHVENIFGASV